MDMQADMAKTIRVGAAGYKKGKRDGIEQERRRVMSILELHRNSYSLQVDDIIELLTHGVE